MRERLIELLDNAESAYLETMMNDPDKAAEIVKNGYGFYADHLLANGVIVPPCKVGDTVYVIYEHPFDETIVEIEKDEFCLAMIDDFGKGVFLTREEAEEALKAREAE